MTEETIKSIYVSGHRNPDIDSLASAAALAELKRRQGYANVKAICPGRLSEKGLFLFGKFGVTPPEPRSDVYFRIHSGSGSNKSPCRKAVFSSFRSA